MGQEASTSNRAPTKINSSLVKAKLVLISKECSRFSTDIQKALAELATKNFTSAPLPAELAIANIEHAISMGKTPTMTKAEAMEAYYTLKQIQNMKIELTVAISSSLQVLRTKLSNEDLAHILRHCRSSASVRAYALLELYYRQYPGLIALITETSNPRVGLADAEHVRITLYGKKKPLELTYCNSISDLCLMLPVDSTERQRLTEFAIQHSYFHISVVRKHYKHFRIETHDQFREFIELAQQGNLYALIAASRRYFRGLCSEDEERVILKVFREFLFGELAERIVVPSSSKGYDRMLNYLAKTAVDSINHTSDQHTNATSASAPAATSIPQAFTPSPDFSTLFLEFYSHMIPLQAQRKLRQNASAVKCIFAVLMAPTILADPTRELFNDILTTIQSGTGTDKIFSECLWAAIDCWSTKLQPAYAPFALSMMQHSRHWVNTNGVTARAVIAKVEFNTLLDMVANDPSLGESLCQNPQTTFYFVENAVLHGRIDFIARLFDTQNKTFGALSVVTVLPGVAADKKHPAVYRSYEVHIQVRRAMVPLFVRAFMNWREPNRDLSLSLDSQHYLINAAAVVLCTAETPDGRMLYEQLFRGADKRVINLKKWLDATYEKLSYRQPAGEHESYEAYCERISKLWECMSMSIGVWWSTREVF